MKSPKRLHPHRACFYWLPADTSPTELTNYELLFRAHYPGIFLSRAGPVYFFQLPSSKDRDVFLNMLEGMCNKRVRSVPAKPSILMDLFDSCQLIYQADKSQLNEMPAPKKLNPKDGVIAFRDLKDQSPPPDFTGQARYNVGLDENGKQKYVILRPNQVEAARRKYTTFKLVGTL